MAQKWINIWGNSAKRGCLTQIIAVAIVVPLALACVFVPLFFANRPGLTETEMLLIMVIPMSLFFILIVGGSFGFLFWSLRKRAAWMDAIFEPVGLQGSSYAMTGRQYHGKFRGRKVDAIFTSGPTLTIYVSTDVHTRAGFSNPADVSQGLSNLFNKTPLDWGSDTLTVFSRDDDWGRALMDEPEIQAVLKDLILDKTPFFIQQVLLEPGHIAFRLYRSRAMFNFQIPPEQGKRWVERLVRLAELAERQPAPQTPLEPNPLTANVRQGQAAKWGLLIVGGVVAMAMCAGVFAIVLVLMLDSGI